MFRNRNQNQKSGSQSPIRSAKPSHRRQRSSEESQNQRKSSALAVIPPQASPLAAPERKKLPKLNLQSAINLADQDQQDQPESQLISSPINKKNQPMYVKGRPRELLMPKAIRLSSTSFSNKSLSPQRKNPKQFKFGQSGYIPGQGRGYDVVTKRRV